MTVSSTTNRVSYTGNDVTTEFSFPHLFYDEAHLEVSLVNADGLSTLKTITTDYTVTGEGVEAGGTVTMNVAPTSTETLVIRRVVPLTQLIDYINGGAFPSESHERGLDLLTMIAQQLNDVTINALRLSAEQSGADLEIEDNATTRANTVVGFDNNGNIRLYTPAESGVASLIPQVYSVSAGVTDITVNSYTPNVNSRLYFLNSAPIFVENGAISEVNSTTVRLANAPTQDSTLIVIGFATTTLNTAAASNVSTAVDGGTNVENALASRVPTVATLAELLSASTDTDWNVKSYFNGWAAYLDEPLGGGTFHWDATRAKSEHNGGTIISPTVPWGGNTGSSHTDFLNGVGETDGAGSGCWVKKMDFAHSFYDFGARGDNTADDTNALNAAVGAGPTKTPAGVFRTTDTIANTAGDFVIEGETQHVFSEKNNEEDLLSGTVINYFGPDTTPAVKPNNTATSNQITLKNVTVLGPKTHSNYLVHFVGNALTGLEYHAQASIDGLRVGTRDFDVSGTALDGYTATAIYFDCTAGWFWGSAFENIYIFGVQTGININATGGFFNSNTFSNVKQYQVWRALRTFASGGNNEIKANVFSGFYVQPNSQSGVWADGVIWLDGNTFHNVFLAPNVYDMPLGTGNEYRSTISGTPGDSIRDNIFVGAMSNGIFDGRIGNGLFAGWGQNAVGQFLASSISIEMTDPSLDPDEVIQTITDQNTSTIKYPRNAAANDYEYHSAGFAYPSLKIDGATGVLYAPGGIGGRLEINGSTSYTVPNRATNIINQAGATSTFTLPAATSGRTIKIVNQVAQAVNSASSNILGRTTGTLSASILPATFGAWVELVADGTNWIQVAGS